MGLALTPFYCIIQSQLRLEVYRVEELTMTSEEVRKRLKLSAPTISALVRRSENPLPHFRVGKRILFPVAAVEQWLLDEAERASAVSHGRPV